MNVKKSPETQSKVLLVEDDSYLSDLLEQALKSRGFGVVAVMTVDEAREVIRGEKIDIVCLDLLLPAENGTVLLEEISKKMFDSTPKVIVISNLVQDVETAKFRSLGVVDYIIKAHVTPSEIVDKVEALLTKS